MKIPLQISFHGLRRSQAACDTIRERAERLERYYDRSFYPCKKRRPTRHA